MTLLLKKLGLKWNACVYDDIVIQVFLQVFFMLMIVLCLDRCLITIFDCTLYSLVVTFSLEDSDPGRIPTLVIVFVVKAIIS